MNKFVRTKSPTESRFSKIFFSAVLYRMDCSYAPMLRFFLWRPMAPQHSAKFRTAFFGHFYHFEEGWRRQLCMHLDAVFVIRYKTGCALQCTKHFLVHLRDCSCALILRFFSATNSETHFGVIFNRL